MEAVAVSKRRIDWESSKNPSADWCCEMMGKIHEDPKESRKSQKNPVVYCVGFAANGKNFQKNPEKSQRILQLFALILSQTGRILKDPKESCRFLP